MTAPIDFLLSRQSATTLQAPGPTDAQLARILTAAGTVPDHGQLHPYRFVVVSGEGRLLFGAALAEAAQARSPQLPAPKLEGIRAKALRSPTLIALIASPKPGKIEAWEQMATAACTGYAIVLAAGALGVGAVWKSVPFTRGKGLEQLLALSPSEEMLGFVHLGTPAQPPSAPRDLLDVAAVTMVLDGGPARPFRP